jgi:hypothetical protein
MNKELIPQTLIMQKEFIPYEEALELKELGFDEPCFGYYEPNGELDYIENHILKDFPYLAKNSEWQDLVAAPTFSQAFKWFREKYNLLATVYSNASGYLYEWSDSVGGTHRGWSNYEGPNDSGVWDTYEEAELACFKKLIDIVKNK